MRSYLDAIVDAIGLEQRTNDPVSFPHRYTEPADIEIAGLIAAGLSYGRVQSFFPAIKLLLDRADHRGGPAAWIRDFDPRTEAPTLTPFYYRFNKGFEYLTFFQALQLLLQEHGSLGASFQMYSGEPTVREGLSRWVRRVRAICTSVDGGPPTWADASRGLRYLLPDPADGSACKRLNMWLRWMVRPSTEGIDFGIWPHIPPSHLVIPLDTHVHRISRLIGLTDRRTANWQTAAEITDALRALCPVDPVRYDFAIAHIGISNGCRGRWEAPVCTPCTLHPICTARLG